VHDAQGGVSTAAIHPTAIVDAAAELAPDVAVGPYAVVGAGVTVGPGTTIGPHAVIEGPTTIGRDNRIHAHAVLGGAPQDMKYRGESTSLVIGDRNTIREFCTLNRGTTQDAGVTRVGDDNWIMAYVHLAHDVQRCSRIRPGDRTAAPAPRFSESWWWLRPPCDCGRARPGP
jgi:UDP-N-acetylglucosamine acyltransferase